MVTRVISKIEDSVTFGKKVSEMASFRLREII